MSVQRKRMQTNFWNELRFYINSKNETFVELYIDSPHPLICFLMIENFLSGLDESINLSY
jgi:hypothetical protein